MAVHAGDKYTLTGGLSCGKLKANVATAHTVAKQKMTTKLRLTLLPSVYVAVPAVRALNEVDVTVRLRPKWTRPR